MMYLSKGIPAPSQKDGFDRVSHCGRIYVLGTVMSKQWRQARCRPMPVPSGAERLIRRMESSGLVSVTEESGKLGSYRLLTNCVLCPEKERFTDRLLPCRTRRLWTWLRNAGLRMTASELIRLEERQIEPSPALLGESGRQQLTERIYNADSIMDGVLEVMMEHSPARDQTVSALMKLLHSRRIILI